MPTLVGTLYRVCYFTRRRLNIDSRAAVFVSTLLMGIIFSTAMAVERSEVVLEEQFVASSFTPYAHAPTIVETRESQRIVVAWFGGSR